MKQYWQRIATKVDSLSLRERAIIFALAALVLILIINALLLDPMFAKQKRLSEQMKADQAKIAETQRQTQNKIKLAAIDPDAENRARLQMLVSRSAEMRSSMQQIQKGLVAPDKMANLLENMLRRNRNLRLVALRTQPRTNLTGADGGSDNVPQPASSAAVINNGRTIDGKSNAGLIYKHGVEITVQGGYLDMMNYLVELEAMPSQLFWGKVVLDAEDHAKATLTLTLYTLSLDKQWLNI